MAAEMHLCRQSSDKWVCCLDVFWAWGEGQNSKDMLGTLTGVGPPSNRGCLKMRGRGTILLLCGQPMRKRSITYLRNYIYKHVVLHQD